MNPGSKYAKAGMSRELVRARIVHLVLLNPKWRARVELATSLSRRDSNPHSFLAACMGIHFYAEQILTQQVKPHNLLLRMKRRAIALS